MNNLFMSENLLKFSAAEHLSAGELHHDVSTSAITSANLIPLTEKLANSEKGKFHSLPTFAPPGTSETFTTAAHRSRTDFVPILPRPKYKTFPSH
jgi:hypothetical protein